MVVALLASVGLATPSGAQIAVDRVVAVVGTALVTQSDIRAVRTFRLLPFDEDATDDDIAKLAVDRELMRSEVTRFATPEPEPDAVDAKLGQVMTGVGDANAVARALANCAMTPARLRAWIVEDLKIARHLDDRFAAAAALSEDDILRYYREQGARFAVNGTVPAFEEVAEAVRSQAARERRQVLVDQWLAGLRRTATIRTPRR
jgi:hypothetical protein